MVHFTVRDALKKDREDIYVKFLPRTRFRGSLMLTVWSWEAERELLIDRSPVREHVT